MKINHDIARCWSTTCEKRETCARYLQRKDSSPSTGHYDNMCGKSRVGYIEVKK